jgi:chromate transport protein ChrA
MVNDIGDGYFGGGFIGAVAAVLFCFVVYIIILVIMSRYYADINLYLEKEELRGLVSSLNALVKAVYFLVILDARIIKI